MIVIDIPMPTRCMTCPCSCGRENSRHDIRTMCRAKEARGDKYVIVNEYAEARPEDCPIKMEVLGQKFK